MQVFDPFLRMKSNLPELIVVDPARCRRDGICALTCPLGLITTDGSGRPVAVADAAQRCVNCGHCVAVCPAGALTHAAIGPGQCAPLAEGWRSRPEIVEALLKGRRSTRVYQNRAVDRDTLAHIIDLARYAPSGINRQPVRWLVIHERKEVRRVLEVAVDWMRAAVRDRLPAAEQLGFARLVKGWEAGRDPIGRHAPHLVVAHANRQDTTAPGACMIALSHLEIAALPFGVGTCWAGYFMVASSQSPEVQAALGLPAGHVPYGSMMIGYPKFAYHRIPPRQPAEISWR
jgi:nitroreductase/NAD-dependent dihydropyrimidine dehydrogenase PreA subunit